MRTATCILCLVLGAAAMPPAHAALRFELSAEGVRLAGLRADRVVVERTDVLEARVESLVSPELGTLGRLRLSCPQPTSACADGTFRWALPDGPEVALEFQRAAGRWELSDGTTRLVLDTGEPATTRVSAERVPLAWSASFWPEGFEPVSLTGSVSGQWAAGPEGMEARLTLRRGGFDTASGRYAGDGLSIDARLTRRGAGGARVSVDWNAGELLLGSLYAPTPEPRMRLAATLTDAGSGLIRVPAFSLRAGESLIVDGSARVAATGGVEVLQVDRIEADLGWLWRAGLQSVAATVNWGGLRPEGRLRGALAVRGGRPESLAAEILEARIDDQDERLAVSGFDAEVSWRADASALVASASWDGASLFRLPLGGSAISAASGDDGSLALGGPLRVPLLDGALVIESLRVEDWTSSARDVHMDMRLEPVSLLGLTGAFGWPRFGGTVAGRFPGLRISSEGAVLTGGFDVSVFDGRVRMGSLQVERAFGALPALAAEVEFEQLDLDQVTEAFEIGRMTGRVSGYVHDPRLLDWRPTRFDAWVATVDSKSDRVISQRAVETLSSLSGGAGSALSGTLLRWFDDFRYSRAGLGCRLAENVCEMRGLRETPEGGYLILKGRSIPRLDIVGFQRRVDWPRLLAQLAAAAEG